MHPYSTLIREKQWADLALYQTIAGAIARLPKEDAAILPLILDHIHVVDRIFQHHLEGRPHPFRAPRSETPPDLATLAKAAKDADAWYVGYVAALPAPDFDEPLDFVFTSGKPARMTRGEILLHISMHGAYHRGNAGLLLQKHGVRPSQDAITDFLEAGVEP